MPQIPPHYRTQAQLPIPPQYQQGLGGDPRSTEMLLAYLAALQAEGQPPTATTPTEPAPRINPYGASPFRPSPAGMSPLGRFNDMVLRQSANLASRMDEGKAAVAGAKQEASDRQRLVDAITHPPPTAPYSISPTMSPAGAPNAVLSSRYGTGGVTFAPLGTDIHGTFGPENMQFGQIGGADEAQPTSGDPMQTTYQQQMIMDSIAKALGKKKKAA